jgi:hypothetical protein
MRILHGINFVIGCWKPRSEIIISPMNLISIQISTTGDGSQLPMIRLLQIVEIGISFQNERDKPTAIRLLSIRS